MKEIYVYASCREVSGEGEGRWFQTFPAYGRYPVGGTVAGAPEGAEIVKFTF